MMKIPPTIFTRRSSGIYAPEHEPIIGPDINLGVQSSVVARLCRPKSGTVIKEWRFRNKLVNTYMDALMTNTAGFPGVGVETDSSNWFAAGTGTTVPAATQTALTTEIASGGRAATTATGGYLAGPPDYCWIKRTCTFSTAQANGTIGEFGWLSASSVGNMRARAVPKDTAGVQTTIVKTSAATLVLDWNIFFYLIQSDLVQVRTLSGTSYTVTTRAIGANINNPLYYIMSRGPGWSASLGARQQSALVARTASATSGTGISASSVDAYTNGSYQRGITFTLLNGMTAMAILTNTGGTSSDTFANIQYGFSPAIVGTPSFKVKLSFTPS